MSEISAGFDAIPNIPTYAKFADKDVKELNHGGIALFVSRKLLPHVYDVTFSTSFIAFRMDFIPSLVFIGCYVQPENSKYFDPNLFSDLCSFLLTARDRKLTPIMGGDMNCRYGDMNNLCTVSNVAYEHNVDTSANKHGMTYGADVLTTSGIIPLNHLIHKGKSLGGDFTYHKAGKKSQIDFAYTTKSGLNFVKDFTIVKDNWHMSDHKPISLEITCSRVVNCGFLYKRANELNYEYDPHRVIVSRHLGKYDLNKLSNYIQENEYIIHNDILKEIEQCNINRAVTKFNHHMQSAHRSARIKPPKKDEIPREKMEKANIAFENYVNSLSGDSPDTPQEAFDKYQTARNSITSEMYKSEFDKWTRLVNEEPSKTLWQHIDWKGNLNKCADVRPSNEELAIHFEKLYECDDPEEAKKIEELVSPNYVSSLDDPITKKEIDEAAKEMKKGGYDYNLDVLRLLVGLMSPVMVLFFNIMFYISYPATLALSLLCALPKKGNLALPVNFRGIQMLAALSALYDRVITIRLRAWTFVSYVQSAFQKGKSTILPLFTLRLLIEIAKYNGTTLYIAFFDLEKAFDKVSRYLMLKKLIDRGIGNCMLQALKRVYSFTTCVIGSAANASNEFRTYSGIRQGAPSSVLRLIILMDDHLQRCCVEEPILKAMHCLLHADDTAVISTNRELFVKKCNAMVDYYNENSLSLNLPKSSYLIINGGEMDTKSNLQLNYGVLEYKPSSVYLGGVVSDTGSLTNDIEKFVNGKRPNVTIKFNNFVRKNHLAPVNIKLNDLDACVTSALIYACETWGTANVKPLEVAYRFGLKRALSLRENVNTEIVYVEADRCPISTRISKQQLNFWMKLNTYLQENPEHPLAGIIEYARSINLRYITYYDSLQEEYTNPQDCLKQLCDNFRNECADTIRQKGADDASSRCGMYLQVNPELQPPEQRKMLEMERILLSRYRSGSHSLRIETGRMSNPPIPREERLCRCNTGIQSLNHVLFDCPLVADLHNEYRFVSIDEAFTREDITQFLMKMECKLGIKTLS